MAVPAYAAWAAVKPLFAFLKDPRVIAFIVAITLIIGAYFKGRMDEKKIAEAAILDTVIDGAVQVIGAQNESRKRAEKVAQQLREREKVINDLEQALLKETARHVTPEMDELCRIPGSSGRMLNEARKSRPVLPGNAGAPDGRASDTP
jgi:hypothetical protein